MATKNNANPAANESAGCCIEATKELTPTTPGEQEPTESYQESNLLKDHEDNQDICTDTGTTGRAEGKRKLLDPAST